MKRAQEDIFNVFEYNRETGVLTRKFKGGSVRAVGAKARNHYIRVSVNGREYPAHRLIWLLVHGEFPAKFIDHINGDRQDNRLCNLRLASDAENKRNVGPRSHNTSGIKGVSWDRQNHKWFAGATINGRSINLGRYTSKEDAGAAYERFAREHHGAFYREPQS